MKRIGCGIKNHHRVYLCILLACALLYNVISYIYVYSEDLTRHRIDQSIEEGYFVNTPGCRMFALNPLPIGSSPYFQSLEPMECNKPAIFKAKTLRDKNYLIRTMSDDEIVHLFRVNRVSEIVCTYKTIVRFDDLTNNYDKETTFRLTNQMTQIAVDDGSTILRIWCLDSKNEKIYHDVHFFLHAEKARLNSSSDENRLSVMILGIDSISHMHYLRSMNLLFDYISVLPHVEFWGYNRVGANWYANLVPLLSGLSAEELKPIRLNRSKSYDNCSMLWKHFKAAGYTTSYAEDISIDTTFQLDKFRFRQQPTDFYLRPVMREIGMYTRYFMEQRDAISCTGSRTYSDILYEFFDKLIPHIQHVPYFSFFWQSQGVHDYMNYAQLLDETYVQLFRDLDMNGMLNRTLVLLMSDHGKRSSSFHSSYQDKIEESQPLLIAIYPKWLKKAYPLAIYNLHSNAYSLVTSFDLHVTLKDLTNLELLRNGNVEARATQLHALGRNMTRGISLFLPIPEIRNCELAGIPAAYCLCYTSIPIASYDARAEQAAQFAVQQINLIIGDEALCQQLFLKEVKEAQLRRGLDDFEFEIQIQIQTMPGEGLFGATIRFSGSFLALNGPIHRANKFGNESDCVQDERIKMFCFCSKNSIN